MTRGAFAALLALGVGAACSQKENSVKPPDQAVAVEWNRLLTGAWDIQSSNALVAGTWLAPMADDPAPGEVVFFASDGFNVVARDRGWLLAVGKTPATSLILDEGPAALTYVVRRPGSTAGLTVPSPDAEPWPLRAFACSAGGTVCAVARWSPLPSASAGTPPRERLSITAFTAADLKIVGEMTLEMADLHAGTTAVGGMVANPIRPTVYLVERSGAEIVVHEVDLRSGKQGWRAAVPISADPPGMTEVDLYATGDGASLLLVQGLARRGMTIPMVYDRIDTSTGKTQRLAVDRPGADPASFAPAGGGSLIVMLDLRVVGGGESPDVRLARVATLDARDGSLHTIVDRDRIPDPGTGVRPGRFALGGDRIAIGFGRIRDPMPVDPTASDVRATRKALVTSLLRPE